eukprot:gene9098-5932_t
MSARPFPVVVFLLFVGSFVRDSAAETIEDTSEWKSCMANPRPCWRLNLAGRGLTGRIPWQISRLRYLRYLQLNDNKLEGTIPSEIQYLTILEGLELANNNLEGQIPGNSIWGYSCTASASWAKNKMDAHLHTLDLHGNKFTGTVPSRIWQMAAYKGCMPLVNLDVSDNLLSGPIRTHFTKYKGETPTKLTSVFTNLWLLGNNWDDAPCVGLCGEFNTGTMTDGKRALTKTWANKCMARTDLHDGLPASGEYVDEMGRCSFKSATCGRGNLYNPLRSILNPDCKRCPVHTYQPKSGHTETECYPQPSCDRGQFISKDKDDLRIAARTCTACPDNTYQSEQEHRLTGCINQPTCSTDPSGAKSATCFAQPTCAVGQRISTDSASSRRACIACPAGQYQDQPNHRETSCINQPVCSPDELFTTTSTARQCPPGYYYNPNPETAGNEAEEEDAIEVRADGCYPCSPGEFASDKARRVQCDVCPTLQTSEAASESDSGCFAKFQSAAADQQFCYGKGSITSDVAGTVDTKPLSRITS